MEHDKELQKSWLGWVIAVCGWLICASLCLTATILLEAYPQGYDTLFPAIILIIFCNVFVFLFITGRWGNSPRRLIDSVIRVCIGEALFLAGIYALGRYVLG